MGRNGDGRYEILGLPTGDYHIAIEPHHASISSENFGGIFSGAFDSDFDREYYENSPLQTNAQIVRIDVGQTIANIDFALGPAAPGSPFIQSPKFPANTPDPNGPYRFSAKVTDDNGVASVQFHNRVNGGAILIVEMNRRGTDSFTSEIAGQRQGSVVEYRLIARDGEGSARQLRPLRHCTGLRRRKFGAHRCSPSRPRRRVRTRPGCARGPVRASTRMRSR